MILNCSLFFFFLTFSSLWQFVLCQTLSAAIFEENSMLRAQVERLEATVKHLEQSKIQRFCEAETVEE